MRDLVKLSALLQAQPTASEALLRQALLDKGYQFTFNEPLLAYIPDFYFPQYSKMVELDGKWCHSRTKDRQRDAFYYSHGIRTLRIASYRVFRDIGNVLNAIERFLKDDNSPILRNTAKKLRRRRKKAVKRTVKLAQANPKKLKKKQLPKVLVIRGIRRER